MRKQYFNAIAWGAVLIAAIAAVFASRTVGIVALAAWVGVIILRHPLRSKSRRQKREDPN
jgi:Flp pilus assembly protein TadB